MQGLAGVSLPRRALAVLGAASPTVLHRHAAGLGLVEHPDAELLTVCSQLRAMQDEWQRLWTLTSDGPESVTPADRAFDDYAQQVWPGTDQEMGEGLVGRLLVLPAFTGEGLQAKAAAVCALEDAGGYSDRYRDDAFTLWETVVRDAAGAAYRPLGEGWKA